MSFKGFNTCVLNVRFDGPFTQQFVIIVSVFIKNLQHVSAFTGYQLDLFKSSKLKRYDC